MTDDGKRAAERFESAFALWAGRLLKDWSWSFKKGYIQFGCWETQRAESGLSAVVKLDPDKFGGCHVPEREALKAVLTVLFSSVSCELQC